MKYTEIERVRKFEKELEEMNSFFQNLNEKDQEMIRNSFDPENLPINILHHLQIVMEDVCILMSERLNKI